VNGQAPRTKKKTGRKRRANHQDSKKAHRKERNKKNLRNPSQGGRSDPDSKKPPAKWGKAIVEKRKRILLLTARGKQTHGLPGNKPITRRKKSDSVPRSLLSASKKQKTDSQPLEEVTTNSKKGSVHHDEPGGRGLRLHGSAQVDPKEGGPSRE